MRNEAPDAGIAGIILATGVACTVITLSTGMLSPWLFAGAGVIVGLWAVEAINRK